MPGLRARISRLHVRTSSEPQAPPSGTLYDIILAEQEQVRGRQFGGTVAPGKQLAQFPYPERQAARRHEPGREHAGAVDPAQAVPA